MTKVRIIIIGVICWIIPIIAHAAAPDFSSASHSGTLTNNNIITISSASNLGTRQTGLAYEYFDNLASEATFTTDNQAFGGDGYFDTSIGSADTDNCTAGGDFHQLEQLGWCIAIKRNASCYSTGYGYRRAVGSPEPGEVVSSGDNAGADTTITGQTGQVWVSFMLRYNPSGYDSNVSFPIEDVLDGYTNFSQKLARTYDKTYSSSIADIYWKLNVWSQGSACGTNIDMEWRADRNHDNDYPNYDDSVQAGASCSDYHMPSSISYWMRVEYMIDVNSQGNSDGEIRYYLDKGSGLVLLYQKTGVSCGEGTDDLATDYVKIGGNFSGTQQYFLTADNNENVTFDYDDIVISTTEPNAPACVYLSNQSVWGSGVSDRWNGDSDFVRQKVGGSDSADYGFKSWSDTGCKFEVNLSGLSTIDTIYLYVTNWSGETNSNGYSLGGVPDVTGATMGGNANTTTLGSGGGSFTLGN